jgi:hypothetical protein
MDYNDVISQKTQLFITTVMRTSSPPFRNLNVDYFKYTFWSSKSITDNSSDMCTPCYYNAANKLRGMGIQTKCVSIGYTIKFIICAPLGSQSFHLKNYTHSCENNLSAWCGLMSRGLWSGCKGDFTQCLDWIHHKNKSTFTRINSSVGIATGYGLDNQGGGEFDSR